jgi:hypothetical protein
MIDELQRLRKEVTIGLVGGSDLNKQLEQLGPTGAWAHAPRCVCPAALDPPRTLAMPFQACMHQVLC